MSVSTAYSRRQDAMAQTIKCRVRIVLIVVVCYEFAVDQISG